MPLLAQNVLDIDVGLNTACGAALQTSCPASSVVTQVQESTVVPQAVAHIEFPDALTARAERPATRRGHAPDEASLPQRNVYSHALRGHRRISCYTAAVGFDYPVEPRFLTGEASMTDWEAVVSQHAETVRRTVHRLVGNDADAWDCVQQAFLEAVAIDRHDTVRNWPALLKRLATVRALDLLRSRYRRREKHDPSVDLRREAGRDPDPVQHAEASELADRLRAALHRLPRRQAEVFCLVCFEQMTTEEVAAQLGASPTAVRMMLSRARRRLQRLLKTADVAVGRNS